MPRKKRSDLPDGAFHVIAHAVASEPLFYDNVDCRRYLGLLQLAVERYRWKVFTFVLMGNHVHLLVEATTRDLSRALWWLHWNYASYLLDRHPPRRGHVFEGRPKTLPIADDRYFLAVARYIANNPVVARVCAAPEQYRWSAHRAILGVSPPAPIVADAELLGWFGRDAERARARYDAFVTGADPAEHAAIRLWAGGPSPTRPPLEEILVEGSVESIRCAHTEWGYSMRAIASALGLSHPTVAKQIGGE